MYESRQQTVDQLQKELYQKLQKEQSGQHLCEVATPGVIRGVNPDEVKPSK